MIGMTFAATLGFAFGASFKSGWVLVHGAVAAANNPNHAAEKPDDAYMLTEADQRFGKYTIIRRGKKLHALLVWA